MSFWAILLAFLGMAGIAAAFNPLRALALAKDIGAFVIDKARVFVAWCREPDRNWWKVGCLSFAGFFALASWYADSQRREVGATVNRYEGQLATVKAESQVARDTAASNRQALLQCQAALTLEVGLRQDVDRLNAEAVARAEAARKRAESDLAAFKARPRPLSCAAALTALETQCATFSDY